MKITPTTRIYVAGCAGMLGDAVYQHLSGIAEVRATDINVNEPWLGYADVRDYSQMLRSIGEFRPDVIVNLAAITDLEQCEREPESAWLTNALGSENLGLIANELDATCVYISTAGVFDGARATYSDFDAPNPINCYGRSKHYGETFVHQHVRKHYVLRAGWMMGGGPAKDKKFLNKIYRQLIEEDLRHLKAPAVIADGDAAVLVLKLNTHLRVRSLGMPPHIAQRLLDHAEKEELYLRGEAPYLTLHFELSGDAEILELAGEPPHRRHQAQVVQDRRAKVLAEAVHPFQGELETLAEVIEAGNHLLGQRGMSPEEVVHLPGEGPQGLGGVIVELPGNALSLLFLGPDHGLKVEAEAFLHPFLFRHIAGDMVEPLGLAMAGDQSGGHHDDGLRPIPSDDALFVRLGKSLPS